MTRLLLTLSILLLVGYSVTGAEDENVITNADLDKYSLPADRGRVYESRNYDSSEEKVNDLSRQRNEMDDWCSRGSYASDRVSRAKQAVNEARTYYNHSYAKNRLSDAEADLKLLEDEAHRKGIPAGWLRCQF